MSTDIFPKVKFSELGSIEEKELKRVVIVSQYKGKWVYCKAKGRETWEIPGGKVEIDEAPLDSAKRELFEETGAKNYTLIPICIYTVFQPAMLFYATINSFEEMPESEIEEISFFDNEPVNLTHPQIHPYLLKKVKESLKHI